MARPPEAVPRGRYRVYLAPMALMALLDILGDAFGAEALRAGRSPLQDLAAGARRLASALRVTEHHARGLVPSFTREGFLKPAEVPLVAGGTAAEPLVAARSAAEHGLAVNCDREIPESLELAPGDLPAEQAAARLGDGLWVGNLWYCNWSDRNRARITGMTRYGCFRVRGGEPGAPVRPPMRFDDSLYDLLGGRLEALTDAPEALLDAGTYGGRSLASRHLPGALVDGLELTL
jgi:predicted Zn-dependent protease